MFISGALLNNRANGQEVLCKCLSHVRELVCLQLGQTWNDLGDKMLCIHNLAEVRESPDGSCAHFRLGVLQELTIL